MDKEWMLKRAKEDTIDSFDEELEQELDDESFLTTAIDPAHNDDRLRYFRELFRLQGELVKLQDWVVEKKLKVIY